ncbi:beta-hydroxylase [Chitinophaga dinghuensis]|uniref:Beta-hydroxylase n=1 Tax=Chitinophaga dinghuensis TaxID=1539050 RepID=A0A327VMF1_9BACT|nr:aspartyl/asparaginyl beta-hydroxylase domain-containing protein [Chitinophaga dinghuensis]RAJ74060.1 beta-hydroxylase [Chitinophaga dinghuensis]
MSDYREFYDVKHEIFDYVLENTEVFYQESEEIYRNNFFLDWYNKHIFNQGWQVLGLRYEGNNFLNEVVKKHCAGLYSLLTRYDEYIYSVAYSSLKPGTIIYPHFDRMRPHNVLRSHLGLHIPDGECGIKINNIERGWKKGELMIFDDSYTHEAWNKTDETRIVLLIDLHRDMIMQETTV